MGLITLLIAGVLIVCLEASVPEKCPALYKRFSEYHTFCKPANGNCKILRSSVTKYDIEVILREHNEYRSRIATGQEQELPAAGNMLQMVWDTELASVAQKHANGCLFEHDCGNCRRVQNFGVGQNLAIEESVTNSPTVPNPNWPRAIASWYDEIQFFEKTYIDPFIAPSNVDRTYGHFSQMVWAKTWRIGCGYVLEKKGEIYKKLYTCNYGPAGNSVSKSMYKAGAPCSACPKNSCCDKTCGATAEYPGLCSITDNKAPNYESEDSCIFHCDFRNQDDCKYLVTGINKWLHYTTLSGNYLGIVLNGGEESNLVFTKRIKPFTPSFCVATMYRYGPDVNGEEDISLVTETFTTDNYEVKQTLPTFHGAFKQQFSQFSMSLAWKMDTTVALSFSVPKGKPKQFFEIKDIHVTEGPCQE